MKSALERAQARDAAHYPVVVFAKGRNDLTRVACTCGAALGTYPTGSPDIVGAYRAHEREASDDT